jgi:hypothetical protein
LNDSPELLELGFFDIQAYIFECALVLGMWYIY